MAKLVILGFRFVMLVTILTILEIVDLAWSIAASQ